MKKQKVGQTRNGIAVYEDQQGYSRFVMNRKAEPTNFVTVVLRKSVDGSYNLWSAWVGQAAPQFPGDEFATTLSRSFWQSHALVWGNQEIQPNTVQEEWPWD